jgi:hypothetical protein
MYAPKFWHVLKFAWVKYFSSFIFFYVLLYHLFFSYIIKGGSFDVVVLSEVDKANGN